MPPFGHEMFNPSSKTEAEVLEEDQLKELEAGAYQAARELLPGKYRFEPVGPATRESAHAYYQTDEQKDSLRYTEAHILGVAESEGERIHLIVHDAVETPEGIVRDDTYHEDITPFRAMLVSPTKVLVPPINIGARAIVPASRYQEMFNNRQRIEFMEVLIDTLEQIRQATVAQQAEARPVTT